MAGQGHLFAFWETLDAEARARLIAQAEEIDLAEIDHLVETLVRSEEGGALSLDGLEPAPFERHPDQGGDADLWAKRRDEGEAALRAGRVAAFTVAGGQGTRLGFDGPKGTYPVTPVLKKTLFQVFAEKIRAAELRYGVTIPWLLMTSDLNHEATEAAFREAGFWGLQPSQVRFFKQGRMPAVDSEGKIILSAPDTIAMSPDGHGGSLRALVRSGSIAWLREKGIDCLSYFQVDNPLVQVIDPTFIGFHLAAGSEMSSKMVPKAYPLEKLGHFCVQDGKMVVVEYSDLPEAMQEERDAGGVLRFIAGSIAIHVFSLDFIERVGSGASAYALPFHRAHKKIPLVSDDGSMATPGTPNGYKFEMFVFDALPFAANPVVIETSRGDDFSPVKNAEGIDSPATCRADQLKLWARWLAAVGVDVPVDGEGVPTVTFEVSPQFADSDAAFAKSWEALSERLAIVDGLVL